MSSFPDDISLPAATLKPGREKSVLARHPWIFSGALANEPDEPPGSIVDVLSSNGHFLGRGSYNPNSQIRLRILSFEPMAIDEMYFISRLQNALNLRSGLSNTETNCFRVLHSEGDGIPGLIVDKYDRYICMQFLTAGLDALKRQAVSAVQKIFKPKGIYERSEGSFRADEGLSPVTGLLDGQEPPDALEVKENSIRLLVNLKHGQKTGMYLDQRDNRLLLSKISCDKLVLNAFSYSGAFGIHALQGGAKRVINVDTSCSALELAKEIIKINGFPLSDGDFVEMDVFDYLRQANHQADVVVLDPPAFAKNKKSVANASRGYKDINYQTIRQLPEEGLLMTFSCSGHISTELFQKILFGAALDAKKEVQLLKRLGTGIDHPVNIYHPEGEYLKGFLCRVNSFNSIRQKSLLKEDLS